MTDSADFLECSSLMPFSVKSPSHNENLGRDYTVGI